MIGMMGIFEKVPEMPIYKIGQKVMGYHQTVGGGFFVAGKIIEVKLSDSVLSKNSYKVEGISKEMSGHLNEDEIILFDQKLFDEAYAEWQKWVKLYTDATETYEKFRSILGSKLYEQKINGTKNK